MAVHATLPDSELHEVKGAASASNEQVLTANGSGGTSFLYPLSQISHTFIDVSTAHDEYSLSTVDGELIKIYAVLFGPIATADVTISFEIDSIAVTDGDILIPFNTSSAGQMFDVTPSANNTIGEGQAIKITTNGLSDNAVNLGLVFNIQRTA